jgi:lambda repressor-like predicted transcriptional regulator
MMARSRYKMDVEKVRRLALDQGMSIEDLSQKSGIGRMVFYKPGHTTYTHTIAAVAAALGVKPSDIAIDMGGRNDDK